MKYHKLPKTIESNYKTMSQEVLRRYQGEIDRYTNDIYDRTGEYKDIPLYVSAHLSDVVRLDAFQKGSYVGLNSFVWKIVAVEIFHILTDPPIPTVTLKLDRVDYAPTQTA